jgi:cell division protein FtsZ
MQELTERISSKVRVFFGAAVDPELAGSVSVTLLAGIPDGAGVGTHSAVLGSKAAAIVYPNATEPFAISETGAVASSQKVLHDREHTAEPLGTHEEHEQHVEDPAREVPLNPSEHAPEPLASSGAEFREMDHLPLEEQVSAPQRSLPIPPYEAAKERRESAAQSVKRVEPTVEPVFPEPIADKTEINPSRTVAADKEADRREVAETHAEAESHTPPEVAPLSAVAKRAKDTVQEQMRFESPNRGGRFEKTDPTIVDGEDLDVPTFMRQHLPLE